MSCFTPNQNQNNFINSYKHKHQVAILLIAYFFFVRSVQARLRVRDRSQDIYSDFEPEDRIVGGKPVLRLNRYPYIASILDGTNTPRLGTRIRRFCIGTLVAPDVILTAAHCQGREGLSPDFVQFNKFLTSTRFEKDNFYAKTYKLVKQVPHPKFDQATEDFDLMLLKMNEKNKEVNPVWLNRKFNLNDGDDVLSIGWGSKEEGESPVRFLRQVQVQIIDNERCNSDRFGYRGRVLDSMICAAGEDKDACQGDSGGPLLRPGPKGDSSRDVQVGIVSWGIGCARDQYPGVYAKIDFEWIMSTICDPVIGLSPESCLDGVVDDAKI